MTTLYKVPDVIQAPTTALGEIWNCQATIPNRLELAGIVMVSLGPTNQLTTTGRDREDVVANRFRRLAEQWRNETGMLSSPTETVLHPAYWEIIIMGLKGEPVVPLILKDLEETGDYWFFALERITGANPPEANSSDPNHAIEAWLDWGRSREYIV